MVHAGVDRRESPEPPGRVLGQQAGQTIGKVAPGEVASGHVVIVLQQLPSRLVEPRGQNAGIVVGEPSEAEGPELSRHRIGPDGEGPVMDGGLDGRVPEALPGRGQDHCVTGGVGVGHAPTGVTVTVTVHDRDLGPRQ